MRFSASLVQPRSRIQPQPLAGPPSPCPPAVPCPLAKVPRPVPNRREVFSDTKQTMCLCLQPNEQKLNINLRCWPLPDILVPYSFSHILFLKHLYIPEYSLYSGRTPPIFRNIPVFLFKKWSPKRIWNMKNIWQRPTPVLSRLLLRARRAAKRLPGSGA